MRKNEGDTCTDTRHFAPSSAPCPSGPLSWWLEQGCWMSLEAKLSGLFATGFLYPGAQGCLHPLGYEPLRGRAVLRTSLPHCPTVHGQSWHHECLL